MNEARLWGFEGATRRCFSTLTESTAQSCMWNQNKEFFPRLPLALLSSPTCQQTLQQTSAVPIKLDQICTLAELAISIWLYVGVVLSPLRPEDAFTEKRMSGSLLRPRSYIFYLFAYLLEYHGEPQAGGRFASAGCHHGKQTLRDLFSLPGPEVLLLVGVALTALPLRCVTDRCAGGKCDVEEENVRGNAARLHQTRLGSSEVRQKWLCCPVCEVNLRNKRRLSAKSSLALLPLLCLATILKYSESFFIIAKWKNVAVSTCWAKKNKTTLQLLLFEWTWTLSW